MDKLVLTPVTLGNLSLKNRLVRAATYEGMGTNEGVPTDLLKDMYCELAQNNVGLIISGFNHFCLEGRAMQPRQCGIDGEKKKTKWKEITDAVHHHDGKIILQLAHTGRQTINSATHSIIWAPSAVRCTYFRSKPKALTQQKIMEIIEDFAQNCLNAKDAGFDGVQIHAAHGYLIHQFFSPHTNRRKDQWGGSIENRARFCLELLKRCRALVGDEFPILLKLSAGDDRKLTHQQIIEIAQYLENQVKIDAIEISYGTMEFALNIIRGGIPLKIALEHNPLFNRFPNWLKKWVMKLYYPYYIKKILPFELNYNLVKAKDFLQVLKTPLILTGGIRQLEDMEEILQLGFKAISMSRPFLVEPDLVRKIERNQFIKSKCTNCNLCTMYCDSFEPIRCFAFNNKRKE